MKDQAGGPIANPGEMGFSHELAVDVLRSIPQYRDRFKQVFNSDKIDIGMVTDAIAAFEETLVTPDSRFDKWLKGDKNAITQTELEGYKLFKEKGCVSAIMVRLSAEAHIRRWVYMSLTKPPARQKADSR